MAGVTLPHIKEMQARTCSGLLFSSVEPFSHTVHACHKHPSGVLVPEVMSPGALAPEVMNPHVGDRAADGGGRQYRGALQKRQREGLGWGGQEWVQGGREGERGRA